jgi:hypothetical protein
MDQEIDLLRAEKDASRVYTKQLLQTNKILEDKVQVLEGKIMEIEDQLGDKAISENAQSYYSRRLKSNIRQEEEVRVDSD